MVILHFKLPSVWTIYIIQYVVKHKMTFYMMFKLYILFVT
jgi:hypothetical protein